MNQVNLLDGPIKVARYTDLHARIDVISIESGNLMVDIPLDEAEEVGRAIINGVSRK